jgi:DHA1 family tetracycline resistance protein-like MFS transporter
VPARKPAVTFIFFTILLDVLGFGLLIPVAPTLVQQLGGLDESGAAFAVGALSVTYALMSFAFSPALGVLSDRFGRRPVILAALFGSGLDYFAMALARSLPILYLTRAINGLSGASFTVANAYVADVTPPEKRAAGFGLVGAAFGLGFVIGPLLGGMLGDPTRVIPLIGHGDIRYPFYAAGALTLCNWLYGLLVLPESLPRERRGHLTWARANPLGALRGLGRYPLVAGLAASFFLSYLAQFGMHVTWALYTMHRFHWTPADIGLSLFAVGMGAAIVQGGLARRIIPVIGEKRAVLWSLALGALCFAGYGAVPEGWMMYPIIVVGALAGVGQPAAQSLITRTVRPYEQGAIQGALQSLQMIAAIFGPLIGAGVFGYFTSDKAPVSIPGAPFFVGAGLIGLSWAMAVWAVSRHGHHADALHPPEKAAAGVPAETGEPR